MQSSDRPRSRSKHTPRGVSAKRNAFFTRAKVHPFIALRNSQSCMEARPSSSETGGLSGLGRRSPRFWGYPPVSRSGYIACTQRIGRAAGQKLARLFASVSRERLACERAEQLSRIEATFSGCELPFSEDGRPRVHPRGFRMGSHFAAKRIGATPVWKARVERGSQGSHAGTPRARAFANQRNRRNHHVLRNRWNDRARTGRLVPAETTVERGERRRLTPLALDIALAIELGHGVRVDVSATPVTGWSARRPVTMRLLTGAT